MRGSKNVYYCKMKRFRLYLFMPLWLWLSSAEAQTIRLNDAAMEIGTLAHVVTPGSVVIDNNAQILNAGNIRLGGDWINNALGLNAPLPGTVEFNSNVPQLIGGTNPTSFAFLRIDNPADVNLDTDAGVSGMLIFVEGKINTGPHRVHMTTPPQTAIAGAGTGSYVNGNLLVSFPAGNYTYKYEIGNTVYAPAVFTVNGLASPASVLGYTVAGDGPNENNPVVNASLIDPFAKVNQYWYFESTASSFTDYEIEFDFTHTLNTGDPQQYVARRYTTSSLWNNTTGSLTAPSKYRVTTLSETGEFVIGEVAFTGIQDDQQSDIFISNPVHDQLMILLNGPNTVRRTTLSDLHGRTLNVHAADLSPGITLSIDTRSISSGLYVLTLELSNGVKLTRKVVKQ